jgi:hypothetical protein
MPFSYLSAWNSIVFEIFIARAWPCLISTLLKNNEIRNVYDVFPITTQRSGHWSNLARSVLQIIKDQAMPVWTSDSGERVKLDDVLFVSNESTPAAAHVTDALKKAGVTAAKVPQKIFELLGDNDFGKRFCHSTVRQELLVGYSLYKRRLKSLLKSYAAHL